MTFIQPFSIALIVASFGFIWAHYGIEAAAVTLLTMTAVVFITPVKRVNGSESQRNERANREGES